MSDFPKTQVAERIPGYTYGTDAVACSPIKLDELERLKQGAGWTEEDEHYRYLAGEVLADQTEALVQHWRQFLRLIPILPSIRSARMER